MARSEEVEEVACCCFWAAKAPAPGVGGFLLLSVPSSSSSSSSSTSCFPEDCGDFNAFLGDCSAEVEVVGAGILFPCGNRVNPLVSALWEWSSLSFFALPRGGRSIFNGFLMLESPPVIRRIRTWASRSSDIICCSAIQGYLCEIEEEL